MLGCFSILSWWLNINYVCTICVCHITLFVQTHTIYIYMHENMQMNKRSSREQKRRKQTDRKTQKNIAIVQYRYVLYWCKSKAQIFCKTIFFFSGSVKNRLRHAAQRKHNCKCMTDFKWNAAEGIQKHLNLNGNWYIKKPKCVQELFAIFPTIVDWGCSNCQFSQQFIEPQL